MTAAKWIVGVVAALMMLIGGLTVSYAGWTGYQSMALAYRLHKLGDEQVIKAITFAHQALMQAAQRQQQQQQQARPPTPAPVPAPEVP